jgi:hypothetical protein
MGIIKQFFSLLWRGWKKFAHILGAINTRILLTITYFVVLFIAFIVTRLSGKDLIDRRMTPRPTYYHPRDPIKVDLASARRQF